MKGVVSPIVFNLTLWKDGDFNNTNNMIIWLSLGIIALIAATVLVVAIVINLIERSDNERLNAQFYTIVIVAIVLVGTSIFGFVKYHNTLVDKAMWNMSIDNYVKTETVVNGDITKVVYKIGNIDFD